MKIKISEILKQRGLFGNDIKTRLNNGQISLNGSPIKGDIEIDVNDNFNVNDAGDFIFNNIVSNKWIMMCKVFGFENLFCNDINFSNDLTEFLKGFKSLKISKKEILIIG